MQQNLTRSDLTGRGAGLGAVAVRGPWRPDRRPRPPSPWSYRDPVAQGFRARCARGLGKAVSAWPHLGPDRVTRPWEAAGLRSARTWQRRKQRRPCLRTDAELLRARRSEAVEAALAEGRDADAIADQLRCSVATVQRDARVLGLVARRASRPGRVGSARCRRGERDAAIRRSWEGGLTGRSARSPDDPLLRTCGELAAFLGLPVELPAVLADAPAPPLAPRTCVELAAFHGVSVRTVTRALAAVKAERRAELQARIVRAREDGLSCREAAARLGCSPSHVSQVHKVWRTGRLQVGRVDDEAPEPHLAERFGSVAHALRAADSFAVAGVHDRPVPALASAESGGKAFNAAVPSSASQACGRGRLGYAALSGSPVLLLTARARPPPASACGGVVESGSRRRRRPVPQRAAPQAP